MNIILHWTVWQKKEHFDPASALHVSSSAPFCQWQCSIHLISMLRKSSVTVFRPTANSLHHFINRRYLRSLYRHKLFVDVYRFRVFCPENGDFAVHSFFVDHSLSTFTILQLSRLRNSLGLMRYLSVFKLPSEYITFSTLRPIYYF